MFSRGYTEDLKEDKSVLNLGADGFAYIVSNDEDYDNNDSFEFKYKAKTDTGNKYKVYTNTLSGDNYAVKIDESLIDVDINSGKKEIDKYIGKFTTSELLRLINFDDFFEVYSESEKDILRKYAREKSKNVKVYGYDSIKDESLKEDTAELEEGKTIFKKVDLNIPERWVVVRYNNKYALMTKNEFEKAKEDPVAWFKEMSIDLFPSVKELVNTFKR